MKKGHKYGTHRVISPKGVLPQPADKLDNNMDEIYDNEILIDVQTLNIDSASFTQISNQAGGDKAKIAEIMLDIVEKQGKHRNPVTGSGGMLLGTVEKIGDALVGKTDLKVGDKIATLVSLSLTPLRIDKIKEIRPDVDQVDIDGKAILFESGIYAKIPSDLPEKLVMSALDVAGAPAQVAKLVRPGNTVLIIGAAGKSGMLCCYEARKRVGVTGKVIGLCYSPEEKERLDKLGFCHEVVCMTTPSADSGTRKDYGADQWRNVRHHHQQRECSRHRNDQHPLYQEYGHRLFLLDGHELHESRSRRRRRRQRRDDDYRKRLYEGTCRDHASGVPRMRTSQKNIHRAVRLTNTNDTCRLSSSSPPGAN